jgi:hypothetical protein
MMTPARWAALSRASLAALAGSALLLLAAAAEWREVQPLPRAPRARGVRPMPALPAARRGAGGDDVVLAAVARDPFRADRRRPPGRYRLPGEAPPPDAAAAPAAPPPPTYVYRLMGTVVLADGGGLAALSGPTGEGKVVRVGQQIDGFRLARVTPGSATLAGHDTTLVLHSGATP